MDGPHRFDLVIGDQLGFIRGRPEPPGELSIGATQRVNPTVTTAKDRQAPGDGRRGINPAAGDKALQHFAGGGVEGEKGVVVHRGDKEFSVRHDRLGDPAAHGCSPGRLQRRRHARGGATASGGVPAKCRPIFRGWRLEAGGWRLECIIVSRSFHEAGELSFVARRFPKIASGRGREIR